MTPDCLTIPPIKWRKWLAQIHPWCVAGGWPVTLNLSLGTGPARKKEISPELQIHFQLIHVQPAHAAGCWGGGWIRRLIFKKKSLFKIFKYVQDTYMCRHPLVDCVFPNCAFSTKKKNDVTQIFLYFLNLRHFIHTMPCINLHIRNEPDLLLSNAIVAAFSLRLVYYCPHLAEWKYEVIFQLCKPHSFFYMLAGRQT